MDGIWGRSGVILYVYLEVCMICWFISGGWCFPLSGELRSESGGLCRIRDNEVGDGIGEFNFRQYGSLDDSQFQNFVEQELYGCSCEALEVIPKLSLLDRYLIGEGSHRRLSTTFRLEMPVEFQSEIRVDSYELIFVERLPLGVFADPFELQHLQQRGVLKDAFVFGDTNLELPSFLSNRSLVEVHMDVDLHSMSNTIDYNLELPLHGRYQPLDDSGYTNVEFGAPNIFLQHKMNDKANIRNCVSVLKDDVNISNSKAIIWRLPSGIGAHERVVSVITFSSAILSTLLIVFVTMQHSGL